VSVLSLLFFYFSSTFSATCCKNQQLSKLHWPQHIVLNRRCQTISSVLALITKLIVQSIPELPQLPLYAHLYLEKIILDYSYT